MNQDLQVKLAEWRQKAADGTLSVDEMRQIIQALRGDRKNAAVTSEAARRTKARSVVKSADELLGELGV